MDKIIKQRFLDHLEVANAVMNSEIMGQIQIVAEAIKKALAEGHKVLFCGNGGSAADSQHLAAEFVGRFQKERRGLPAIALTVDTSILTAVGNDYGYDKVFVRQVEALAQAGDVLVGISTNDGLGASGENIARLFQRKHYYFVPYGQDDPIAKPSSLKADFARLPAALDAALAGRQLQPVLLQNNV